MNATEIATYMVNTYGDSHYLTPLKLHKLLYLAQIYSLRQFDRPLFDDAIMATDYSITIESIEKRYGGRQRLTPTGASVTLPHMARVVVDRTMQLVGRLTSYDLVQLTTRKTGAYANTYDGRNNSVITTDAIKASQDMTLFEHIGPTLSQGFDDVFARYPNTFKLLENS